MLENVIKWTSNPDDLKEKEWPIGLLPTNDGKLVQVIHINDNKIELKQIFPDPDIVKE